MNKKSFVKGAIILGLASILCKIIGAIFRIPLTSLIGAEGIGIYQLVYPIFALFLVVSSGGIPIALSKIIAKEITANNNKNVQIVFKNAKKIMLILGCISTLIIIVVSKPMATIQNNQNLYICYLVLAPSVLLATLISSYRGYFQGFQVMTYSAVSQIIEQLFKLVFGLILAYFLLPLGIIYGVIGAFLGILLSELVSFIYMYITYRVKKLQLDFSKNENEILSNIGAIKLIIKESLPITFASIIIPISSVIDSLIIIKLLNRVGFGFDTASSLYGLDSGLVTSLINLPSVIAVSICVSLMPSISSSFALKNTKDIETKTKLAIKIVWYFTLPCVVVFFLYSTEFFSFLYGNLNAELFNQLQTASLMLKLRSFSIIYIALNQILITTLQAINKSYFAVFSTLIASLIKILLTIILVLNKSFNIYGLVVADIVCSSFASIINLIELKKKVKISFSFKEIFLVPFLSVGLMSTVLILFKMFLNITISRLLVIISIAVAFIVYLFMIFIMQGFNFNEINNTKFMKLFKKKKP